MSHSSARGYVEPLAALAAVFALGLGVALYAGTVTEAAAPPDREVAASVLAAVQRDVESTGVLSPAALRRAEPPTGVRANLTLVTPDGRWTRGDEPPPGADRATSLVAVRRGGGRVVPGRLAVTVW